MNKVLKLTLLGASLAFSSSQTLAGSFNACSEAQQHPELADSLCANIAAPLQHDDQSSTDNINLFVRKFPAQEKPEGSIWLIAGGPGESGASFYKIIEHYQNAFPTLDIYIPDHRGTGASSTICKEEQLASDGGVALVGAEWGSCFGSMYAKPDHVKAFSISNAAKDLRQLINQHSSPGKRYVYAVSYGTQLSLRLLQLENVKIDGLILDSLVPLQDDKEYELSRRSFVVDEMGKTLLKKCQQDANCGKGKDLLSISAELSRKYQSLETLDPKLKAASLSNSLGTLLDIPPLRNDIPTILLALQEGNGQPLLNALEAAQHYYAGFNQNYANFGSSVPLVQVITAAENNLRPEAKKTDIKKEENELSFTSPLPTLMAEVTLPRYQRDQYFAKVPENMPRTLVLHGDMDPKTHHLGARKHVQKLKSMNTGSTINMITIDDAPHFIALNAPACFKAYANAFLGDTPIKGDSCSDEKSKINF
ncbi:alpha/beta hydrolase [Pseudoteredinibacter isoporae]|uniref:Pimeloyl-ACP methyl ester carboxylesterase n=1 Tax=Pseudoteredinibacter isoporae TaxID=570281 RepID=A0A7X0JS07_9GAMM|nr:alpha/beta fold hydrolase [Pseudoteredinibacter isoporae]MBB6520724.1 pimeloyl-ACP methyl ester carboxylesterase [Pseudoteredinibacter isoporae]NHO86291.1 alpha/beta fold hydrolase [Pseudoteredinibacter isoporae]NIB25258.1 alpha/beta fold hydrolase [Pseudoteredinibacter isoporae]